MAFQHRERLAGSNQIFSAPTYEALVTQVVHARRKKGRPNEDYNKVYNELRRYKVTSPKIGAAKPTGKSVYETRPEDIINGAKAVFKTTILGDTVSQTEILRRSEICKKCPKLEYMKGCMACGAGKAVAALFEKSHAIFGKQRYEIPADLKKANCGVCKCYLSNMLPAKGDVFKEGSHASAPDNCWVKNLH